MKRKKYPANLSDAQWERLQPLLERDPSRGGRPRTHALREIVNALLYVLRGGISWRAIPHDLPPWESVYDHYRRWKKDGTLERVHDALRQQVRATAGREPTPSVVIIDRQSVKTTEKGDPAATTPARSSSGGSATS